MENQILQGLSGKFDEVSLTDENGAIIWSKDVEKLLEKIRVNSTVLSHHHKAYYNYLKDKLKFFRIPTIIISAVNTVLSISLGMYTQWSDVIICCLNLAVTILSSIEMFLGIQKAIENHFVLQRDFYLLSIDIFKNLELKRENRKNKGVDYLESVIQEYNRLFEMSSLQHIKDKLTPLMKEDEDNETPSSSVIGAETHV
jgi:hypothetical protein